MKIDGSLWFNHLPRQYYSPDIFSWVCQPQFDDWLGQIPVEYKNFISFMGSIFEKINNFLFCLPMTFLVIFSDKMLIKSFSTKWGVQQSIPPTTKYMQLHSSIIQAKKVKIEINSEHAVERWRTSSRVETRNFKEIDCVLGFYKIFTQSEG